MTAEDVVELYSSFVGRGAQLWVDGGWGIDALLQRQTRAHTDLDVLLAVETLPAAGQLLFERGFVLSKIWPENRWVRCRAPVPLIGRQRQESGFEVATAAMLSDSLGRVVDIHAVRVENDGISVAAWETDFVFPIGALAGQGKIAGTPVLCVSTEMQKRTHAGYPLPPKQVDDMRLLHERFG